MQVLQRHTGVIIYLKRKVGQMSVTYAIYAAIVKDMRTKWDKSLDAVLANPHDLEAQCVDNLTDVDSRHRFIDE